MTARLLIGIAGNFRQDLLESASSLEIDLQRYRLLLDHARLIGRERGIDETFKKYNINVLVGPAESPLTVFAAATGWLIYMMQDPGELLMPQQVIPSRVSLSVTSTLTVVHTHSLG